MTQSRQVDVVRVADSVRTPPVDHAAVEEPLEVRLHGKAFAVIMRTPGADRELADGFLLAERVMAPVLTSLPDRLRAAQPLFEETGGLHACGLFRPVKALIRGQFGAEVGQSRGALARGQRVALGFGNRSGLDGAGLQRGGDA